MTPVIHIKLKSNQEIVANLTSTSTGTNGDTVYTLSQIRYLNYSTVDGVFSVGLIPFSPISPEGTFDLFGEVVMGAAVGVEVSPDLVSLYKQQTSGLDLGTSSSLGGLAK